MAARPARRGGAVAPRSCRDCTSVVLWGPGEEDAARAAVDASAGAAHLAPETGLRDLVALARSARLMISGDTGPLHIASALGVPVVALFGPTSPQRNGPWAADDISLSRYDGCDCHYERQCRRNDAAWCLGAITVDDVTAAAAERLRRAGRAGARIQDAADVASTSCEAPRAAGICRARRWRMALARPTPGSLVVGGAIAVVGEAIRVWASGHIEKGREVTRSGPYRFVRHPLYLGSAIIGAGFMIAAWNAWVALLVTAYLATTLLAAMRSEEAALDAKFGGEYSAYRDGRAEPVDRAVQPGASQCKPGVPSDRWTGVGAGAVCTCAVFSSLLDPSALGRQVTVNGTSTTRFPSNSPIAQ